MVLSFRMLPYVVVLVDLGGPLNYYGLSHMGESHPLLVKDYCRFSFLQHRMHAIQHAFLLYSYSIYRRSTRLEQLMFWSCSLSFLNQLLLFSSSILS